MTNASLVARCSAPPEIHQGGLQPLQINSLQKLQCCDVHKVKYYRESIKRKSCLHVKHGDSMGPPAPCHHGVEYNVAHRSPFPSSYLSLSFFRHQKQFRRPRTPGRCPRIYPCSMLPQGPPRRSRGPPVHQAKEITVTSFKLVVLNGKQYGLLNALLRVVV